jgi:SAM-dependent methyltransferase
MSAFDEYAPYYAAFYQDKDYAREADYVLKSLKEHGYANGPVGSILELGCGQGGHAIPFARSGLSVVGMDRSQGMIAEAERRRASLPPDLGSRLRFLVGDIRDTRVDGAFDAALSLFHVVSYLPHDDDLQSAFRNARAHLRPGGLFAFDFWNGDGVLRDPPGSRTKEAQLGDTRIVRDAVAEVDRSRNRVDVHYHFTVTPPAGSQPFSFDETHHMRYLFPAELERLCADASFERVTLCEWLADPATAPSTWNGYFVARAR